MGIFNREYMRDPSPGGRLNPANWSPITLIIALNLAVFLLWQVSGDTREFLIAHFTTSWQHLRLGYVWTLLTSVFSHERLFHLALNMLVLYFFGGKVVEWLGPRVFWVLYLSSGVVASFAAAAVHAAQGASFILGASGAVTAVLLFSLFKEPRATIYLWAVVPVTAWLAALIIVGQDVYGLAQDLFGSPPPGPRVAHGAHLGGAGCGALFFLAWSRGWLPLGAVTGRQGRRRRRSSRSTPWSNGPSPLLGPTRTAEEEARLDSLLQKVNQGGLDSLSPTEREFLISMSKKARRS